MRGGVVGVLEMPSGRDGHAENDASHPPKKRSIIRTIASLLHLGICNNGVKTP